MEKVIKDGKVAVLYSPGYGAGWSTWNWLFCMTAHEETKAIKKAHQISGIVMLITFIIIGALLNLNHES